MRRLGTQRALTCAAALALLPVGQGTRAQGPGEPRPFCDEVKCGAGTACCTDDSFAIELEGGSPVLDIGRTWAPGLRIQAAVFLDARTTGIQGWSYGVRHDPGVLRLESVYEVPFCTPNCPPFLPDPRVEACGDDPACKERREGFGFISAQVLSVAKGLELTPGRHHVATATYEVLAPPGRAGTRIEFTERLARAGSPPASVVLTIEGRNRVPRFLTDGRVHGTSVFHRGDADSNGRITISDAVSIILFLHLQGPRPPCLEAADWDDGGIVNGADAAAILAWLFSGGAPPAAPGPPPGPCGPDREGSPSDLGCADEGACT